MHHHHHIGGYTTHTPTHTHAHTRPPDSPAITSCGGIADSIIFHKALSGRPNRAYVIMRFKDALCPIYFLLPYLYRTHYGRAISQYVAK